MKWRSLGLIFNANGQSECMHSHAMLPFAKKISGSIYRIYFSSRDNNNRSHGFFLELDLLNPGYALRMTEHPILAPGETGAFDDAGTTLCSEVSIEGDDVLFYTGWSLGTNVPFVTLAGSATLDRKKELAIKNSVSPFFGCNENDPNAIGFFQVLKDDGKYKMWYESSLGWENVSGKPACRFVIKYAESENGVTWKRFVQPCLGLDDDETILSRPTVLIENGQYQMWYSVKKNEKYSLGYATSSNGEYWIRKDDQMVFIPSMKEWDNEEICYPFVFRHERDLYMLYNGNGYGKTGFGLARLEE